MSPARGHSRISDSHRLRVRRAKTAYKHKRSSKGILAKLIFVLCSVFFVISIWKLFNSWQNSQWITGTRLTIVVASDNPKVYSYNPQAEKLVVFEIPDNTQIETSRGYGQWFAGSLWKLGEQEKLRGELLRESVQKSLGLPIDGWIEERGEALFAPRKLGVMSALFEALTTTRIKSNLTFFDRLHLLMKVGIVGISARREMDLTATGVLKKEKLGDGAAGFSVIPDKAKLAFEGLRDDLVFAEEKKVVIVNASKKSGLANDVGQIATVLGIRIIGAQTSSEKINECEVRGGKSELKSLSARRLIRIFDCNEVNVKAESPQDLELWLGENFAKKF
ncbi:MAG: Uncharacterized protein G01um10145_572 [Microgenomates group bacterium Gr01-1014_5]|nr:MAG: Uncharacterized protein G01um10145_572 [Microgenomates group bacterium Gr01-1014_5]